MDLYILCPSEQEKVVFRIPPVCIPVKLHVDMSLYMHVALARA
jgi:hypothetical protein